MTDTTAATILVVDDDPYGLTFFRSSLKQSGYRVVTALHAREAQERIRELGANAFDAVLTDFRMPEITGLDLLAWLREEDATLGTVIVTAQGEKEIIRRSLSEGACDFLEKPVTHQLLGETLAKAVAQTRRMRKFEADQAGLRDAGRVDHALNTVLAKELRDHVRVFYRPFREVGGDFFTALRLEDGSLLIVVGDVSGHDIQAGFLAAYFQGVLRGYAEAGRPVDEALALFNRMLCHEWKRAPDGGVPPSLAIAAAVIDPAKGELVCYNCGFPPPMLCDRFGFTRNLEFGSFPLGWDPRAQPLRQVRPTANEAALLFHTDGLVDLANELEVDILSLIFRLTNEPESVSDQILRSTDDILLIRFKFELQPPIKALYQPIVHESYSGDECENIDQLQSVWRRSIQFAVGEEMGDRLYDLLICLREGMLNALVHGCERSPDKIAVLHIAFDPDERMLRIRIDDPGKGHQFDLAKRIAELERPKGDKLGLGIVQHLSDDFSIENKGASLVFDFAVKPGDDED